ncbi:hypothetical protein BJ912DRAFT_1022104 [Pholiota molesta]|nr:hypothetical protein BJ912DRAFT_1022104 [Pholiota molesta]
MPEQITLYTAKICPWAHRAEIALKESKLPYKRYEIDLKNKPEWYAPSPSPESEKIAESGVLIELVADLSNEDLLPKDPILRAKARFFIETVTPLFAGAWRAFLARGEDPAAIFKAGYAVGQWSIADAAVTPFFARAEVSLKNDIGVYEEGKGKATWETLETDPKYARFRKYFNDVKNRDSFKETFFPVHTYLSRVG